MYHPDNYDASLLIANKEEFLTKVKIAYKELATFTALYQGAALRILTIFDIGTARLLSSSPSASILCPSDLHSLH